MCGVIFLLSLIDAVVIIVAYNYLRHTYVLIGSMYHGVPGKAEKKAAERNDDLMDGTRTSGTVGTTIVANEAQYYMIGGTRIKITEHFPASGKEINEIIVNLIAHKIREEAGRTA